MEKRRDQISLRSTKDILYHVCLQRPIPICNSMDPDGTNMLDVEQYYGSEDGYVDLQNSLMLVEDNQEYVDEAIKIDRFMTNEEIYQVVLEVMREENEIIGGPLLTETSLT